MLYDACWNLQWEAMGAAGAFAKAQPPSLVSTLEPCPMCAGAALLARVGRVVFGAEDPKAGSLGTLYNIGADPRLNHEFEVHGRVLEDECAVLLQDFFARRR